MKKIVIIGGGGHAKVIISILKRIDKYDIIGYTDPEDRGKILGIKYVGNDDRLKYYYESENVKNAVIGNSSSGIVEVPFFKIPTINIGDRQKGRIRHKSVVDTNYDIDFIKDGIEKAMSIDFKESLKNMKYKFGDGDAAKNMVNIIKSIKIDEKLMRKKLEFPGDNND